MYEDGAVIVGSVDGNRIWGKELKNVTLAGKKILFLQVLICIKSFPSVFACCYTKLSSWKEFWFNSFIKHSYDFKTEVVK